LRSTRAASRSKYGIGLKEMWQVKPEKSPEGPGAALLRLAARLSTGGGSFLYHLDDNLVAVGFVVHLNYKNPYLSPFDEFQRFKTHSAMRDVFEGGKRILWLARHHRGRLAVGAEADLPGRGADRLLGGLRQRAAHQGQPQRHPVRHAGGGARSMRRWRPAGHDEVDGLEESWRSSEIGQRSEAGAQRQAALVELGTLGGVALGGIDMWLNTLFGLALRHA
jgi:electron-transferring-flavoprotein dehydrogenase